MTLQIIGFKFFAKIMEKRLFFVAQNVLALTLQATLKKNPVNTKNINYQFLVGLA